MVNSSTVKSRLYLPEDNGYIPEWKVLSYTAANLILLSKVGEDQQLEMRTHPRQHRQLTIGGELGNPYPSFRQTGSNFTSLVRMLLIFKTVSLKEHSREKITVMNLSPATVTQRFWAAWSYISGSRLLPSSRVADCGNNANFYI